MRKSEKFRRVLTSVCEVTEVEKKEILSASRVIDVCTARSLLFLLLSRMGMRPVTIKRLCEMEGWSSLVHSTVLKNITRASKLEQEDEEFQSFLNEVTKNI